MSHSEQAPFLPPPPASHDRREQTIINPVTGRPILTHIVDGKPVMSRSELAAIEAHRASTVGTEVVATTPRQNGNEFAVTTHVRFPDGMNQTLSGLLGAIMTSPATASIVKKGLANGGLAAAMTPQDPTTQELPYLLAEHVETPQDTATTEEQPYLPARVAGHPSSSAALNSANGAESTAAIEPTGIRRVLGPVVVASILAGTAWFTTTTTLSMFGKGEIQNENPVTMNWGELPDKISAIYHSPPLIFVPDNRGNK